MLVAIDIGNTNIVIALYKNGFWTHAFRHETKEPQPEFYYEQALRKILLEWEVNASEIRHWVISSVVPDFNQVITDAVISVSGHLPLVLHPDIFKKLDMHVPHPYEIGSDIVANAYAAINIYESNCIIVDFGTALTFTIVHQMKGILGVTIAPGLKTAIQSLATNTAQLPVVPLELPRSVIGHDTVSAIQAGVLWGYVGLVKEIVGKVKSESDVVYKVIATGGLSSILHPLETEVDVISKTLTLDGMRLIYHHSQTL